MYRVISHTTAWVILLAATAPAFTAARETGAGPHRGVLPLSNAISRPSAVAQKNQQKAHKVLNAMIQTLGGQKWMTLNNSVLKGRMSWFYHGEPTGEIRNFEEIFKFPDQAKVGFGKTNIEWAQVFNGESGWEIILRGKRVLPPDQVAEHIRFREHSLQTITRIWLKDPKTILIYGGQSVVERHMADKITLIDANNNSASIQTDTQTHLPLRVSWERHQDKDMEAVEYSDYHMEDGIATPYDITTYHNGGLVRERFFYQAAYNVSLPQDAFDPDQVTAKER